MNTGLRDTSLLTFGFPVELFRCQGCGQVYISEELAIWKMAEIEMLLEDK